jgi:hypothetical protein
MGKKVFILFYLFGQTHTKDTPHFRSLSSFFFFYNFFSFNFQPVQECDDCPDPPPPSLSSWPSGVKFVSPNTDDPPPVVDAVAWPALCALLVAACNR